DMSARERASLVQLSGGSLGAALRLAGEEGLSLATEAEKFIENAGEPNLRNLLALGDRLAKATDGLEIFGNFLLQTLTDRIRARAVGGGSKLDQWIEAAGRLKASFERSAGLHLEPRQTLVSAARILAGAARRAGPV